MVKIEDMCTNIKYNYKEKHDKLKAKMQELDQKHLDLMSVLDAFNGVRIAPINYNQLLKFPLFEWVHLNDKTQIQRRNMLFGDHLNFDTLIERGGEFGKHFHEDVIESTEIISGSIMDVEDDNKAYLSGDVMHYEKGQKHMPVALEDSVLRVIFKP